MIGTRRGIGIHLWPFVVVLAVIVPQAGRALPPRDEASSLRVEKSDNTVSIFAGERQVLEYRFVESPRKPYVSKLFTPSGVQVLRDSPRDHQHHHALMFALAVDSIDFWAEAEGTGQEKNRSLSLKNARMEKGLATAGLTQTLEWVGGPENQVLLLEKRTVLACKDGALGATLLTWQSRLQTPPERNSSILTGSHYFGLGLRFVESMDQGGHFMNSEGSAGEPVRGSERLTAARWCAYTASADGHPVTVAVFDHPANPRHPARMFTMTPPFAYLAATLNLWKEPMTLTAGQDLALNYGVAVWDGETQASEIERLYRLWVEATPARASRPR
jgi:Family of unknown function (DUF6807)